MDVKGYIKEIGRGRHGARSLTRADALSLARAMINGELPDLQLGAVLLAMRMKGESLDELSAFVQAANEALTPMPLECAGLSAVVIPAYNGARRLPNLTPLLALLVARRGVPVLLHGTREEPGRVSTCEILEALGIPPCEDVGQALVQLRRDRVAFLPIELLEPRLAGLLGRRRTLGVRNTLHSAVKLLQPFTSPAVRMVSVTHPEYLTLMRGLLAREGGDALLLRGVEGEVVASVRRVLDIDWWHDRERVEHAPKTPEPPQEELTLPERDCSATAYWIESVLAAEVPVPRAIAFQCELTCRAAASLGASSACG